MRAQEFISEAPLADYEPLGDFTKPGPFRGADKRLVPHPTNKLKAARFFEQTPYNFRLFFSNIPGTGRFSEYGPMGPNEIRNSFSKEVADQIIAGSEDSITVLFVGNKGDSKVMLTPWIMAHRIGHAIQAGERRQGNKGAWAEAERHFFKGINQILTDYYGKSSSNTYDTQVNWNMNKEYAALFNAIGTQRSSRTGQIRRPYEFLYEMFAQYLGTGKITLNPLPQSQGYGRKAWGRSTQSLNMRGDPEETKYTTEVLARDMEIMFGDVLSSLEGKILVM
jgi:hypothetical protein